MENPLLLSEVAKLHQRDVAREAGLRQVANQAKTPKIAKPGLIKRFVMVSFSSNQKGSAQKQERLSPDERLILKANS